MLLLIHLRSCHILLLCRMPIIIIHHMLLRMCLCRPFVHIVRFVHHLHRILRFLCRLRIIHFHRIPCILRSHIRLLHIIRFHILLLIILIRCIPHHLLFPIIRLLHFIISYIVIFVSIFFVLVCFSYYSSSSSSSSSY